MTLLGQNGLVVCSLVIASALAAKWVLDRAIPIVIGGALLVASAAMAALHGAWLAMTHDTELDAAKANLGDVLDKPKPDYAEQTPNGRPGKTIEIDFEAPLEESVDRIERA